MESNFHFLEKIIESQQGLVVFSLDKNYCYTFFSPVHAEAHESFYGDKVSSGKNILEIIKNPDERRKAKANFDRALRGESFIVEEEYTNPELKRHFLEYRYSPVNNDRHEVVGLTVFVVDITRAKQAERERLEIESAYRILFETTPDAIFIMQAEGDDVGQIVSANEAAAFMHGYSHDEFLKLNVKDLDSPEDSEQFGDRLGRILAGEKMSFEVTHRKKDGTLFSLEVSTGMMSVNGRKYTMSINRDITGRKEIEEAVRERERFIHSITSSSPDIIYVFDLVKRKNIYTNYHIANALGYSIQDIEEMENNFLLRVLHPDDFKRLPELLQRWKYATDRDVLESEFRLKNKEGEWRWFISRDTVFKRDKKGRVIQFVGTAQDRTANKKSELDLRQSEERFKRLQEASFGGIGIHDQGKFLDANQGLADITGYTIPELLGMDGIQLIAPEYREHVIQKVRLGHETPYDVIGLKKDRSRYHLEVQGKNIPFQNQSVRVTEFRDITERKKIEESIREQNVRLGDIAESLTRKNEQLEEFTQIVSHNLRAPVGNIVSLLSLYADASTTDEQREYIQHISNSSNLLLGTLNELNEVLKIKQSRNIERQELEFNTVFIKVCQMLSSRISELDAEIDSDFREAPVVQYPNIYLESILLNLLSNALKYNSQQRKSVIRIRTFLRGPRVVLEVADNGLGINLEKYGHQMFKMRKTFHEHPESRGLGLFLIKNQIESMGGQIAVKSEVNIGTTFHVILA